VLPAAKTYPKVKRLKLEVKPPLPVNVVVCLSTIRLSAPTVEPYLMKFKILAFFIFALIATIAYFYSNLLPVSADPKLQSFVVNQGDSLSTISSRLQKNKLIKNRLTFLIYAYYLGVNNQIQAGSFRLSQSMTLQEIITKLSKGGSNDYWLKIIDGQRVEEIGHSFPSKLEGYLFPDSYLIPNQYSLDQILAIIKTNFDKKLAQAKINSTNNLMSESQIIILASLLEREGRSLESKQYIAGILLNRLNLNIALRVDSTVQYARDTKLAKNYWEPLSKKDLIINSLYNTYKYPGLPPAPICNPGYDSIYAAYHPIASDYLYYITGTDGLMHYAKTLDEHNQNIAKYLK
jgi:UPF0755 protein